METILKLLPLRIAEKVRNIDKDGRLQEVRLKINKPVIQGQGGVENGLQRQRPETNILYA